MPNQKLTLWLLNRTVDWHKQRLLDALGPHASLGRRLTRGSPEARPGRQADVFVNLDEDGYPGELMHESYPNRPQDGHFKHDEYFVPIPVKCVGNPHGPFWREVATTPEARRHLQDIAHALEARFAQRVAAAAVREPRSHDPVEVKRRIEEHFGEVTMNLCEPIGYYEILRRATEQTGAKNVLVGYSQGGTVARYLAFLDERVAPPRGRCIHGIVTVQSPNRGSPIASSLKGPEVSTAAMAILLAFIQWLPEGPTPSAGSVMTPIWQFLFDAGRRADLVGFMNELLDAELAKGGDDKRAQVWRAARKWLSGLSGSPDLAFWDLDPVRLLERGSVLESIASHALEHTYRGAVIGASNQLTNLIELVLASRGLLYEALGIVFRKQLDAFTQRPSELYGELGLRYPDLARPDEDYDELRDSYLQPVAAGTAALDRALPSFAHDFVIPSVSQLLIDSDTPFHLGNHVNPAASHLSGADGTARVHGKSDEALVIDMLRRM